MSGLLQGEDVSRNGYLAGLVDRLRMFDPWVHRHPWIEKESKAQFEPTFIADDPKWELTEIGRLFDKLIFTKGLLLKDQT
jgi:hypothetical protein